MKLQAKVWSLFVVVGLLLTARAVLAGTSGKIAGRIIDRDNKEGLPGVNVLLVGTTWGAVSDPDGYFQIINVPPGTYKIAVSMIGYTALTIEDIKVNVDRTTTQNISLSSKTLEGQEVVIKAERPVIEKDRTSTASYVDAETIQDLPVQEVSEIIQLQAGVVTGAGGDLHFRGGRSREVAYLIDGVSVSNAFSQSGGSNVAIENSVIKELQVISGTFNAEYGAAQSAIINVVTKNAETDYHGEIQMFSGDNLSSHSDRFLGVDQLDPLNEKDVQATFSGPVPKLKNLGFFATARYNNSDGHLYGERRYSAIDGWKIDAFRHWFTQRYADQLSSYGRIPVPDSLRTGDRALIPMSQSEQLTFTGKLIYIPKPAIGITYSLFGSSGNSRGYSDSWRYAPDGRTKYSGYAHQHFLAFRHSPSASVFYNLRGSYQYNYSKSRLYEDTKVADYPGDSGYLPLGASDDQTGFVQGDNQYGRSKNVRKVYMVNGDLNWQVNRIHFIKMGFEAKQHDIHYNIQPMLETDLWKSYKYSNDISGKGLEFSEYWALMQNYWANWNSNYESAKLRLAGISDGDYTDYNRKPLEAAAYIQDKMELGEIVLNAGVRLDYFQPNAKTLVDKRILSEQIGREDNLLESKVKTQLSPRLGFSFPVSDRGAFHVSYGHFFQMPSFQYLFERPLDESMTPLLLAGATVGDPNLKPERTIAYEVGLQQELNGQFGVDVTLFYKDIRNQLGLESVKTVDAVGYYRYINRDYGNVKGFTLSLEKMRTGLLSGSLDYTFQYSRGSASDPNFLQVIEVATRMSGESIVFPERQILPLDWDQRHTVNLVVGLNKPGNWGMTCIATAGSGMPYSPSSVEQLALPDREFKNRARKPMQFNVDLKANKQFIYGKINYSLFIRVYNLLDRLNENTVYAVTGRATQNARLPYEQLLQLQMLQQGGQFTMNEWDNHPSWFSEPRRVQLGLAVRF
ncbi:TonB-dependent receptor [bacterium]|nr:TonB-dependent receptor [bacterium]